MSINKGNAVLFVSPDMSFAFDSFEKNVRFSRLKDMFDLSGKVLQWFQSYLGKGSKRMSIHGMLCDIQLLSSSVPQDSLLGSLVSVCPSSCDYSAAIWL